MNSIYSQEKLNEARIKELLDQAAESAIEQDEDASPSLSARLRSMLSNMLFVLARPDFRQPLNQHQPQATQDIPAVVSIANR